jgi:uncharacterized repeat protein (TIGR03943 family)
MTLRAYRTFQALLFSILAIFLLEKLVSGSILLFINRRFVGLTLLAVILLAVLSQTVLSNRPAMTVDVPQMAVTRKQASLLVWMAIPVLIGLLVPARPLGSSAAAVRGFGQSSSINTTVLTIPTDQWTIYDWVHSIDVTKTGSKNLGKKVDVTGFVYKDPRLTGSRFLVARFAVACCVADALAIGLVVDPPANIPEPGENTWVRVTGSSDITQIEGMDFLLVHADSVENIPEPQQPYIYP